MKREKKMNDRARVSTRRKNEFTLEVIKLIQIYCELFSCKKKKKKKRQRSSILFLVAVVWWRKKYIDDIQGQNSLHSKHLHILLKENDRTQKNFIEKWLWSSEYHICMVHLNVAFVQFQAKSENMYWKEEIKNIYMEISGVRRASTQSVRSMIRFIFRNNVRCINILPERTGQGCQGFQYSESKV